MAERVSAIRYQSGDNSPKANNGIMVNGQKNASCFTKKVIGIILMVTGLLCVLIGIIFGAVLPKSIHSKIVTGATTCELADVKESFSDPYGDCETCVPLYFDYFPFHIVNAAAYEASPDSTKLIVQERGPYTYRKRTVRSDVSFAIVNGVETISFKAYNTWEFIPSQSCKSCTQDDRITTFDIGYLSVMTGAGGEVAFMTSLVAGIAAAKELTPAQAQLLASIDQFPNQLLRAINGLNSLDAVAMTTAFSALGSLLAATPEELQSAIISFMRAPLKGTSYAGFLAKNTIRQYAYGKPSFMAGIAVAASGRLACGALQREYSIATPQLVYGTKCAPCDSNNLTDQCLKDFVLCGACSKAVKVIDLTDKMLCPALNAYLAKELDNQQIADAFTSQTCGQCANGGLFCLAPLPGSIESSGFDWTDTEPMDAFKLQTVQQNGCTDVNSIGEYVVNDGITTQPIWEKGINTIPTATQIKAFGPKKFCDLTKKDPSVVCSDVIGGDGASFPPAGADLNGLKSEIEFDEWNVYVAQARRNITMFQTGTTNEVEGVSLTRFAPKRNVLRATAQNVNTGIGVPVNGVVSMHYNTGAGVFLSFPFFLFGDTSLLSAVDLFTREAQAVTPAYLYNGDVAKESIVETYGTYLDIEPATGKTMNARKRLMGSYSIGQVGGESAQPISNLNYPSIVPDIIVPTFWGQERVTITSTLADKFSSAQSLGSSCLPVLIVGLLVGLVLIAVGGFFIKKYKDTQVTFSKV